jgi:hypothetical protein
MGSSNFRIILDITISTVVAYIVIFNLRFIKQHADHESVIFHDYRYTISEIDVILSSHFNTQNKFVVKLRIVSNPNEKFTFTHRR